LVRDLIALVLDFLDRVGLGPRIGEVVHQLMEQPRRFDHVLGLLLEEVEEADFAGDQIEHDGVDCECNGKVSGALPRARPRRFGQTSAGSSARAPAGTATRPPAGRRSDSSSLKRATRPCRRSAWTARARAVADISSVCDALAWVMRSMRLTARLTSSI